MRFHDPLDEILGTRSKVRVLRHLARSGSEKTGRELARAVGLDHKAVLHALSGLVREGVVERRRAGRASLYRINRRHVLVQQVIAPAFEEESGMLGEYATDLRSALRRPVMSVVLFGSVARGEERPGSDVDILLVTPRAREIAKLQAEVDKAMIRLAIRFGNVPQILVFDRTSFARGARRGDPFVSEVLRTGRVIHGRPFSEVLKDGP